MRSETLSSSVQLTEISEKLNGVKGTMVQTIDNIMERGQKLELLVDKTDNLESTSFEFYRNSQKLRRKMLCKKIKMYSSGVVLVTLFCWLLSSLMCGFDYQGCHSKNN